MENPIPITAIGWVTSVYKEKFGTPRQSGVVPIAEGTLHFYPPYDCSDAFAGLEGFSHIWVISQFHLIQKEEFRPKVRPPKLGGKKKVGVFASRAPYRPNRICLSAVKLEAVITVKGKVTLKVSGIDLVEGTPILDIKPYLPYADCYSDAATAYRSPSTNEREIIPENETVFSQLTEKELLLITQTLQAHPEPAYAKEGNTYGISLSDFNLRYRALENQIIVTKIEKKH